MTDTNNINHNINWTTELTLLPLGESEYRACVMKAPTSYSAIDIITFLIYNQRDGTTTTTWNDLEVADRTARVMAITAEIGTFIDGVIRDQTATAILAGVSAWPDRKDNEPTKYMSIWTDEALADWRTSVQMILNGHLLIMVRLVVSV
jgi:hypothetical protein